MRFRRIIPFVIATLTAVCMVTPAAAEEVTTAGTEVSQSNSAIVEIYDYNDLLQIRSNPSGTYRLMADIDLADVMWEPIDFSGTLDGNGHALLNITVNQLGSKTAKTYDGNLIDYDTSFAGVFGILQDANIANLRLLGVKVNIDTNEECFVGAVAGYMDKSRISDVQIEGEVDLKSSGKSFGVGGFVGFGNGQIENSRSDMTLICVDKDVEYKEEQFMGGAYAAGYIDLNNNDVTIHGYDSDHGYVHNGGLVGMYVLYPSDEGYKGYITNNKINGGISFFEDNEDRRAYCESVAGEVMNWTFNMDGNEDHFIPDEHFEYDVDLKPHYCENPEWQDVITPSTHSEYGYTTHNCNTCMNYSYRSTYTPLEHVVEEWTVTQQPTAEEEGLQQGSCKECGTVVYQRVPRVASGEAGAEESAAAASSSKSSGASTILIFVIIIVVIIAVFAGYMWFQRMQAKKARARRKAAQRRAQMRRNNAPQKRRPQPERPHDPRRAQAPARGQRPAAQRPAQSRPSASRQRQGWETPSDPRKAEALRRAQEKRGIRPR